MLNHRPVAVRDERLWLVGLALLLAVPVVAAVGWFGVPTGTATVAVDTAGVDGPVNVTVADSLEIGDRRSEIETRRVLTGDGGPVYETRVPQEYVVSVRTPGERCTVEFRLAREDEPPAFFTNRLLVAHRSGNCTAVDLTVTTG
jgi:hypothetical protein